MVVCGPLKMELIIEEQGRRDLSCLGQLHGGDVG
jgi:hypothetical protein